MPTGLNTPSLAAMVLYVIVAAVFHAKMVRHKAVMATLLSGFLFLPSVQFDLGGFLNVNRGTLPVVVALIGVLFRDMRLLGSLRLCWFDLPMLAWCFAPLPAAVTVGDGIYEGFSLLFYQTIQWGGPYLLGRLHCRDFDQAIDHAKMMFYGGLIYAPLCLLEIRFSPMLHNLLYGFHQHQFIQSVRGTTYRPTVFLQHGLMVAIWMGVTTYLGAVLRGNREHVRYFGVPVNVILVGMALVLIVMQSLGATLLILTMAGLTLLVRATGWGFPLLLFALIPALWVGARVTGMLETDRVNEAASVFSPERSGSLLFRLDAEDEIIDHAWSRPAFGWSARGFNRVAGEYGGWDQVVVDGLWVIAFSKYGFFGLSALLLLQLVPILVVLRHVPPRLWRVHPRGFLVASFALILATVAIDNLMNAMVNPIFLFLLGGVPTAALLGQYRDDEEDSLEDHGPMGDPEVADTGVFRRGFLPG